MYTRTNKNQVIYDNFAAGAARNTQNPTADTILLTFHDKDNDEVHLFEMRVDKLEQYFALVRQTIAGQSIQVAGTHEMPRGAA